MNNILFVLILLFPFSANAACNTWWEVSTLARNPNLVLNLTAHNHIVANVPSAWFRQVDKIKNKINRASGLYTKLFLCDSSTPNAFASRASGQNVVMITLGMLKLVGNDWDVYAALLGHENTHLVRGHGQQWQTRRVGIGILELLANAALGAMTKPGTTVRALGSEVVKLGSQAVYASYSRDDEREADRDGMIYAHRSGYDPSGAIRLHQKLGAASDFLSSHPSSANRISTACSAKKPMVRSSAW